MITPEPVLKLGVEWVFPKVTTDMPTTDRYQNSDQVRSLLERYFDLGAWEVEPVMADWLQRFDIVWIHSAVIEALYQGRYKLVSVTQILHLWSRRGYPVRHYSREFETIISGQSSLFLTASADLEAERVEKLGAAPQPASDGGVLPLGPMQAPTQRPAPFQRKDPSGAVNFAAPSLPLSPPPETDALGMPTGLSEDKADMTSEGSLAEPERGVPEVESLGSAGRDQPSVSAPQRLLPTQPAATASGRSPIKPLQPLAERHRKTEDWLGSPVDITTGHPEPIPTFVPQVNPSGFEQRLQAVARRLEQKP